MFFWFQPTCPVDSFAKLWIEHRLGWLADEFGRDVFTRRSLILPSEEFFPDRYDGSEEAVRVLVEQVCRYMDADTDRVLLKFFADKANFWLVNEKGQPVPRPAGLYDEQYGRTVIHLESSQLTEPMDLVGTTAHEIAHLRLLGENRITSEVFDNELLTDLTVVFHGLGIFLANSPRAWPSGLTTWPGTQVRKPEYMTQPMFGYALAHAAWHRSEKTPEWAKFLRPDARTSFQQALRYLWATGDSEFRPKPR